MQATPSKMRSACRRLAHQLACAAGLGLGLCGCASFWDDVTSRDFSVSQLFHSKDPLVVLKDSGDGNERYKALAALQEPLHNGGSQKDQDTIVEILRTSAQKDSQPLCRMAAIRALGRFKDPRAADTLDEVYVQNLTFEPEMTSLIRQECLKSLAETAGPVALRRLVLVAKEPAATGTEHDRQETLNRRLTAVRGLGKFKDAEAMEALASVLRTDKDIGLRDRALESLQTATGKQLPAGSPQWDDYLRPTSAIQPTGGTTGWNPAPPH